MRHAIRIEAGTEVRLDQLSTRAPAKLERAEAERETVRLAAEMDDLLDLLAAAARTGLLVVLQGRDAAGKDGAIRHVLEHTNVQSARVVPFKVPTAIELAHDFLWRVHGETPGLGSVVLFNRSHYEDVLVVRVHDSVPERVWRGRYEHIVNFERLLAEAGIVLVKLFLHVSKEEQEERLLARERDAVKSWKLAVGDWREREHWDAYSAAYAEALARTSSEVAPWLAVPADQKWYRDLAVTEAIVLALRPHRAAWLRHLEQLGSERAAELNAYRGGA